MVRILKRLLLWGVTAAMLVAGVFVLRQRGVPTNLSEISSFAPMPVTVQACAQPITYRMGTIDPAFGISREEFTAAIEEAAGVWEQESGRKLFAYQDEGAVTINLVFDERQADTIALKHTLDAIQTDEGKYKVAKQQYETLATTLKAKQAAYDKTTVRYESAKRSIEHAAADFDTAMKEYEDQVAYWNTQGGAPEEEYAKLEHLRRELKDQQDSIQKKQKTLKNTYDSLEVSRKAINDMVARLNMVAGVVNTLAAKVNTQTETYNQSDQMREEFEAGVYRVEGSTKSINIYQFFDRNDLVLVLAHELGHVLGFDHIEDAQSLMYYRLGGQELKLGAGDKQLVSKLCQE